MISEHNEIEAKFDAPSVSVDTFKKFCFTSLDVKDFKYVAASPDDYYESGPNVVRQRLSPHELTVKRRKNESSTRDRQEIDLHLAARSKPRDAAAFLEAAGFSRSFRLIKEAHIFWARLSPNLVASFVMYDVWLDGKEGNKRRFIEVEAEKGSDVTAETAKRYIRDWTKNLQAEFKLGEPLNESLWEIYSGRRYQLAGE